MAAPAAIPLVDDGLGNSAHLVDLGDGRGLVVDAAFAAGHVAGAAHVELGDLMGGDVDGRIPGGPGDWSAATGTALASGTGR
jgi:hypothetical protein